MAFSPPSKLTWLGLGVLLAMWVAVDSKCPKDWLTLYDDNQNPTCYFLYKDTRAKKTFDGAQDYCEKLGGYLARLTTATIDRTINSYMGAVLSNSFWIGLTDDNKDDGPWRWVGGPVLGSFNHIKEGTNNWPGKRDCFYMLYSSNPKWQAWIVTHNCDFNKLFVCQKDYNDVTNGTTIPPVSITCPAKWKPFHARKTCLILSVGSTPFVNARKNCRWARGDLVKIEDGDMNGFVNGLVANDRATYWIGLNDLKKENTFAWNDETTETTFKHWNRGEPNNSNGGEDCVAIVSYNLRWNDDKCDNNYRFICQRPPLKQINTQSPQKSAATTTPIPGPCPAKWKVYPAKKMCLVLSAGSTSYARARGDCRWAGGDLVKVEDRNMNSFLNGLVAKDRATYWIGLNDIKKENLFAWNDETTEAKFKYWNHGEPNNADGGEDCVAISSSSLGWNDEHCDKEHRFICQKPYLTQTPQTTAMTTTTTPSANCGAGWEEDKSSPYCYKFQRERLSWTNASQACQKVGGDLVSIHSSYEQSYITERTVALPGVYWIGANDREFEGRWQWSDKGPFEFFHFYAGVPRSISYKDCVGMLPRTGTWGVFTCSLKYSYICKKIGKRKPTTIAPKTSPAKVPAGKKWGCPPGWRPFRFSCYLIQVFPNGVSWLGARKYCQTKQAAELASISDKEENEFVSSSVPRVCNGIEVTGALTPRCLHESSQPILTKTNRGRTDVLWIGFGDRVRENTFTWTDSSQVTYTNWNNNEPNDAHNEDCVGMYALNGRWNDDDCSDALLKMAACKKSKSILEDTSKTIQDGCPPNYYGYDASCYVFLDTALSFANAEKICQREHNRHLATVYNYYVQSFLSSNLSQQKGGTAYWIGLSSTSASQNKYVWISGASVDITPWAKGHTGNERNTCVAMQMAKPTGLWLNKNCSSDHLSFICETPRRGYTNPPTLPSTTSNAACPGGWFAKGARCYKAVSKQTGQLLSWQGAREHCRNISQGGELATIDNNDVSVFIAKSIFSQHLDFSRGYWIGLNDIDKEGGYVWADGSPYKAWNLWGKNEPNDANNGEDCVEWKLSTNNPNGQWNDLTCSIASNYICQFPRGSSLITEATMPTISIGPTGGKCGGSDWSLYKNHCYYLSLEDGDKATMSWFAAREECHLMGAELTSIITKGENDYLTTVTSRHKTGSFWIGMNDIDIGHHRWVDKSTKFFWGFAEGEPNDADGQERCVELQGTGLWNDKNCQDKIGFICKRRPGNYHPTIHPTTMPTGGCPPGYSTHDLASHCYIVYGQGKLTFDRANALCPLNYGDAGRLASIRNEFEQNFILTLMKDLKKPAWIGLTNKHDLRQYQWLDNTVPSYDNWAANAPRPYQPSRRRHYNHPKCVTIQNGDAATGEWQDGSCYQNLPYVCQLPKNVALPVQKPDATDCNPGYVRYGDSCYKYVSKPKTWDQADALCKSDGGHLVSLTNNYESAFFDILTAYSKTDLWVGLRYDQRTELYKWTDGWPVISPQWGVDQPKRLEGGGCISSNMSTHWEDTSCLRNLSFVCEVNLGTPPSPTGVVIGVCDRGWMSVGGYCYFVENTLKNSRGWARGDCRSKGGELASILSKGETLALDNLLKTDTYLWIGLQVGTTTGYKWDDESPVDYTHFKDPTSPDYDKGKHEECIAVSTTTGYWVKLDCSAGYGYLCKKRQTKTSATTTTAMTITDHSAKSSSVVMIPSSKSATFTKTATSMMTTAPGISTDDMLPTGTQSPTASPGKNTTVNPQRFNDNSDSNGGLSDGGVAGVVIAVIVVIAIAILVAIFVRRRYSGSLRKHFKSSPANEINNALYSITGGKEITFQPSA